MAAARPQNIGIKALELYFPSQVRSPHLLRATAPRGNTPTDPFLTVR